MGTGVVSAILYAIPFQARWLYYLSIVFFVFNVLLFSVAFLVSVLRYSTYPSSRTSTYSLHEEIANRVDPALFPAIWTVMIQDSNNSLFVATMPMGFATLINMFISICVPLWGPWAIYFAWSLWIVDTIIALSVTMGLAIILMSKATQRELHTITAAQLLPIAATIVAVVVGSRIAEVMIPLNEQYALGTVIASYAMWGLATPMAFMVLTMYWQRLTLHQMVPREVIVSAFLPLGPLGYGGYALIQLGKDCLILFPDTHSVHPGAGQFAYLAGFFVALIMWGWGLIWFVFALANIYKSRPLPFNMGWWGFTFPLGVYSLDTILLGEELPSRFFRVLGTIWGTAVILLWIFIFFRTAMGAWNRTLFVAPCLANLAIQDRYPKEELEDGVPRKHSSNPNLGDGGGLTHRATAGNDPALETEDV